MKYKIVQIPQSSHATLNCKNSTFFDRYLESLKKLLASLGMIIFHKVMDPHYRPDQLFESSYFVRNNFYLK